VIILSLIIAFPYHVNSAEFVQDTIELNDHLADAESIKIIVRKITLTRQYPYKNALMWGGDVSVFPKNVIAAIDVRIGNEKIIVPLSAFCDLGDPHHASLEKAERGFKLIVSGGDAAVSYKAALAQV